MACSAAGAKRYSAAFGKVQSASEGKDWGAAKEDALLLVGMEDLVGKPDADQYTNTFAESPSPAFPTQKPLRAKAQGIPHHSTFIGSPYSAEGLQAENTSNHLT